MCAVCIHIKEDCSHLPFKTMPTISRKPSQDGTIIVKCTSFERDNKDTSPHNTERSSVV
jgi:hypothetical protein